MQGDTSRETRTPEQTDNTDNDESEVVGYKREVDNLSWDKYAPVADNGRDISLIMGKDE